MNDDIDLIRKVIVELVLENRELKNRLDDLETFILELAINDERICNNTEGDDGSSPKADP
jgi:cell division septum initiation protein DivIVA